MNYNYLGEISQLNGECTLTKKNGIKSIVTVNEIDVKGASKIILNFINGIIDGNGNIINGNSTNLTVYIYGSVDNVYSTNPIGISNVGANSSDFLSIKGGLYKIKLDFENNDTINSTVITYIVSIIK